MIAHLIAVEQGWTDATLGELARRFLDAADEETQQQFIDFLLDVQRSENPDGEAGHGVGTTSCGNADYGAPGHDGDPSAT
ncbi:hypothetical protein O7626_02965 [Micromonospora sp. WMMD1102]|uniref:hypothetical protein n=1 Tax=Micromonospora sp. WMMD1102 TaxID=3016105 RepID=UPI002415089A|nr:hypothetical protein [Micromonospora sp. WMMD1102]MDG4784901.1 hypothetical protein [Micromonospora sp. WMMD1102]